jgi:hypothetical protein
MRWPGWDALSLRLPHCAPPPATSAGFSGDQHHAGGGLLLFWHAAAPGPSSPAAPPPRSAAHLFLLRHARYAIPRLRILDHTRFLLQPAALPPAALVSFCCMGNGAAAVPSFQGGSGRLGWGRGDCPRCLPG